MFKITKDGATVAMTEAPNYIKQAENGCFVLCPEAEATGIAHNGTVYHLLGRPDMAGAEITVMLEETDAGVEIAKAADATGIVFVTMAEAGSVDATTAAEHADLFAPWAVPVAYTVGQRIPSSYLQHACQWATIPVRCLCLCSDKELAAYALQLRQK